MKFKSETARARKLLMGGRDCVLILRERLDRLACWSGEKERNGDDFGIDSDAKKSGNHALSIVFLVARYLTCVVVCLDRPRTWTFVGKMERMQR